MNIAIDIDGVLSNFTKSFVTVINQFFPDKKLPEGYQPNDWNYSEVLTPEEMKKAWNYAILERNLWLNEEPLVGSLQLKAARPDLAKAGINIYYTTNRPETDGATSLVQTNLWLKKQGLAWENSSTIVAPHWHDKAKVYKHANVVMSIDDRVETVADCQHLKVEDGQHAAYLLDQPWNRAVNLPRVKSVSEFLDLVLVSAEKELVEHKA